MDDIGSLLTVYTTCPHCNHRFDAAQHVDKEPFLVIEAGKAPWKLLQAYRVRINEPKLDEELYEIARELYPELDIASPWRIITSLIKSGYVRQVGKRVSSRNRLSRTCVLTRFGHQTLVEIDL